MVDSSRLVLTSPQVFKRRRWKTTTRPNCGDSKPSWLCSLLGWEFKFWATSSLDVQTRWDGRPDSRIVALSSFRGGHLALSLSLSCVSLLPLFDHLYHHPPLYYYNRPGSSDVLTSVDMRSGPAGTVSIYSFAWLWRSGCIFIP